MRSRTTRRYAFGLIATSILVGVACSNGDDSGVSATTDGGSGGDAQIGSGSDGSISISDSGSSSDAHASDAAPDAGGGCAGKTYKICEDFESSTVGKTPNGWTVLAGYGATPPTTVVASDVFHSGSHSLKTSSAVSGASRVQKSFADLTGTTAGTHWGRVFYKVQSPPPQLSSQGPHATFVALEGNLRAGELRVVDTQQATSGKIQLLVNTPDDNCCKGTDFTYTVWDGNWHCAEWYVDQATQSYRFFLDKTEVTALAFDYGAGSTTADMPTAFTSVAVGAIFYTPTLPSPLVTWFDDLAIDDKQIGCE
jgi:hypothetical protein